MNEYPNIRVGGGGVNGGRCTIVKTTIIIVNKH